MKNSVLYPVSHPISELSIKNFKSSLDKWFSKKEVLDIGISPDSILLDGDFVDRKNELYREVGSHIHSQGVSSVNISKGVDSVELTEMFRFLKMDAKLIREGDACETVIPELEHIIIRAVDYSLLLEGEGGGLSEDDEELWRTLTTVSRESRSGKLPREREEFIRDFLQDPKISATVLNKVYRDAVVRMEGDETVDRTRESMARIYDYMAKNPGDIQDTSRSDVGRIVSRLDPEFILKLFSPTSVDGRNFDLAGEMMKDIPDEFFAGFIESLIKSSGGFNENLLKVFERLSPGGTREGKIVSMVAGRLSDAPSFDQGALAELQTSIKEVFASHPESGFMSQMYTLTVNTFIDRKAARMDLPKDLVAMVESYNRAAENEGFKGQEAELILNLLWQETDPVDFERLCAQLTGILPELFKLRDIARIKDIFSFFFVDIKQEKRELPGIKEERDNVISILKEESVARQAISLLAGCNETMSDKAVFILEKIKTPDILRILLDEFCTEKKEGRRNNLALLFEKLSEEELDIVEETIKLSDSRSARDLFNMIKRIFPERSRRFVNEILSIDDATIKREILEGFVVRTEQEKIILKALLKKEKDPGLRRKVIVAILKTKDKTALSDLFACAGSGFFEGGILPEIIETAGELGSVESVPLLIKLLERRDIFGRAEKLKIASVVALGRIHSEEAMEALKKAASRGTKEVKEICDIIIKLKDTQNDKTKKADNSSNGYQG